jgi:hypothetical protein
MRLSVCSRKKEELYLKACYIIDGQTANFFYKKHPADFESKNHILTS